MSEQLRNVPRKWKKKVGRPAKKIDWDKLDILCQHQWTMDEICDFFDLGRNTLWLACKKKYHKDFETYYNEKRSNGIGTLRSKLFQQAISEDENGKVNTAALIFALKNYAGMADKVEAKNTNTTDIRVTSLLELIKSAPSNNGPIIDIPNSDIKQLPVNNSVDSNDQIVYPKGSSKVTVP